MEPTIATAARASLEILVNKALRYDPASANALTALQGQVLAVTISFPSTTVYVVPTAEGLRFLGHYEAAPNTHLKGTLPALIQLALRPQHSLSGTGVELIGSTALLIELRTILSRLDIDWEEALSQWLGDVAGPFSADVLRKMLAYTRREIVAGTRLTGEYLTEESNVLASPNQLESFYDDVREAQLRTDRLQARVDSIRTKIAAAQNQTSSM